jgi:hypothetical protein
MKIKFVYFIVLWLNALPVRTGISDWFSPRELLVRWGLDYKKHWWVLSGTYCEKHDKLDPSNSMVTWKHKGIALGPTGNLQGSMKLYCLNTGRVLKRCLFIVMPMPHRIIKQVNKIGEHEKQGHNFHFLNRNKDKFDWTDKVTADNPTLQGLLEEEGEHEAIYPNMTVELPGVPLEDDFEDAPAVVPDNKPDFRAMAVRALKNADIDLGACLQAAQNAQWHTWCLWRDRLSLTPTKTRSYMS